LKEITKFAEDLSPSVLFQTFFRMLMTYSQRRSKLEGKAFDNIVEQLKPDKNMAKKFKTIFDVAEEKAEKIGMEKGMEKGMAIGKAETLEFKRQTIMRLIKTTQWDNTQIAEIVDAPVSLVETIRLELKKVK
jgi:hypothetical protein